MQYSIVPVKAKINDTENSNLLDIVVSNDTGIQCVIHYKVLVASQSPITQRGGAGIHGTVKIADTDYSNYTAVDNRLLWCANFICTQLTLTLA